MINTASLESGETVGLPAESSISGESDEQLAGDVAHETTQDMQAALNSFLGESALAVESLNEAKALPAYIVERTQKRVDLWARLKELEDRAGALYEQTKERVRNLITTEIIKPPIIPGEVFNPEREIKKILTYPKAERPVKLQSYKEKYICQLEGIAAMQVEITANIRRNPDISKDMLYEQVGTFGHKYGFPKDVVDRARTTIDAYIEKHQAIRKFVEEHSRASGQELYRILFNKAPEGKVEVYEGPMTLFVRIYNPNDYTYAALGTELKEPSSAGKALAGSRVIGLEGVITIQNASKAKFIGVHATRAHEELHVFARLFRDEMKRNGSLTEITRATVYTERKQALQRYLRRVREPYEVNAKREILAHFKGETSAYTVFESMTKLEEEGGRYDYLAAAKKTIPNVVVANLGGKHHSLVEETVEEIFVNEYNQLLRDAIIAFNNLAKAGLPGVLGIKGKYSVDKTIALLMHQPLAKWPKIAKRLLES